MSNNKPLVFYKNRDNTSLLRLYLNEVEIAYVGNVTKVEVKWRGGSVASDTHPTLFSITSNGIRLKLGSLALTEPVTLQALIVIFSATWPNGVVWDDRVTIKLLPG